jgi:hypothetical protein
MDRHYLKVREQLVEMAGRWSRFGQAGQMRSLGYLEQGNMGSYRAVLDNPSLIVDLTQTRRCPSTDPATNSLMTAIRMAEAVRMAAAFGTGHADSFTLSGSQSTEISPAKRSLWVINEKTTQST